MSSDARPGSIAQQKVAVIGAGCAGLAAARRLHDAGVRITVFDKSRGVGGRMATRRIGEQRFDHGAQFFTARGAAFRHEVEALATAGRLAAWPARWGRHDGAVTLDLAVEEQRFAGFGGMNALPKALAEGLDIVLDAEITDLARTHELWSLESATSANTEGFDVVILAVPSPQAVPLLTGITDFASAVAAATYAPCWAVMATFPTPLAIAHDAITLDDGMLRWVARNAGKPGFPTAPESWILHATPEWSRANIEQEPETIREIMLAQFCTLFGVTAAADVAVAHRWRYALVLESAGEPYFWDSALRIGACGDWCLGPRVEAAYDSGLALAEHLLQDQAARRQP